MRILTVLLMLALSGCILAPDGGYYRGPGWGFQGGYFHQPHHDWRR